MDYQRLRVSRGPGNAPSAAAYRLLAPHLAPATRGDANHRHKSAPHPGFLPTKAIRICDHARHVSPAVRATPRRPMPAATDYRPSPPALARHAAHIPLKAHSPRPRGSDAIDPRVVGCARTDQYAPTKSHVQAFAEGPHAELLAGCRGALRWRAARCTTAPPPRGRTDHEIGRQSQVAAATCGCSPGTHHDGWCRADARSFSPPHWRPAAAFAPWCLARSWSR